MLLLRGPLFEEHGLRVISGGVIPQDDGNADPLKALPKECTLGIAIHARAVANHEATGHPQKPSF